MDNICTACLCAGRNLYFIGETGHYNLYSQILNEIPVYDFSDVCVRVCWECRAVLQRFGEFKMLVKRSYTVLLQQFHQNDPPTKQSLIRQPTLRIHQLHSFSIPDIIKDEPLDYEDAVEAGKEEAPPSPVQEEEEKIKDECEQQTAEVEAKAKKASSKYQMDKQVDVVEVKILGDVQRNKVPSKPDACLDVSGLSSFLNMSGLTENIPKSTSNVSGTLRDMKSQDHNQITQTETDTEEKDFSPSDETDFDPNSAYMSDDEIVTKEEKKKVKKSKVKIKVKAKVKKKKPTKKKKTQPLDSDSGALMHNADGDDCDSYTDNVDYKEEKTQVDVIKNSVEDSVIEKPVKKKEPPKKPNGAVKDDFPSPELVGGKTKCPECGKMFSSKKTYRYHLNTLHKGQNRYPCPRCGKVYQWKSNLGRHMRSHQALDSGELYCALCERGFASVATYRQHLRISRRHVAESEFTFSCNECGKRFVNKTRLRDHIDWDHLHKVKFRCQLCDKPFKCHTSLYVHMQNVHRNKKRENLCHICGKSYQNAAKLKYHITAMHTSETPYTCAVCGAAFGWYSSLYRHSREVHDKMKLQPKKVRKPKRSDLQADLHTHAPPGPA